MLPLVTDASNVNKLVQVIDPTTGVWENARIIAFPSSWSVKIRFTNWSTSKAGLPNVEVPQHATSRSQWPIRRPIVKPIVRSKRNHRSKKVNHNGHETNPENKVCYETIFCVGPSFADPTDLPSFTELQKLLKDSKTVKSAKIIVNDPFCNRLLVAPEEMPHETVSIDYDQLCSEPAVIARSQSQVAEEEVHNDPDPVTPIPPAEEPQGKQPRKSRESIPKVVFLSLETRQSTIAEMRGEIQQEISLIVAPYRNEILEKSFIVVDDSGKKMFG